MKTSDFYFDLPEELIAQTPLKDRVQSRLMVIHRQSKTIEHKHFYNVLEFMNAGDCIVLNNTKVMPARIFGTKDSGAVVEFLLLRRIDEFTWETLVKPGKKAKIGSEFAFGEDVMKGIIVGLGEEGTRHIRFEFQGVFETVLDQLGSMPLPPYITEKLDDPKRYNTVYAKHEGSAAAPTAGLHFTESLMEEANAKGVRIAYVTLHVGLGTFRPVKVDNVDDHKMHAEFYTIDAENASIIRETKANGGKIIAVGTTSTRTLETIASHHDTVTESSGWTDIFIYPGYQFKVVDSLITNFHLPESTLIMLVSALSDRELILNAYKEAVQEKYRFFSFGDAMLIVD